MLPKIESELAKKIIKEYSEQNAASPESALKTKDGENLNGFFIDKETLEFIISNPDCEGIHIMLAKHPDFIGSNKHIFNILITSAKTNSSTSNAIAANTDIFGPGPTCPTICPPSLP